MATFSLQWLLVISQFFYIQRYQLKDGRHICLGTGNSCRPQWSFYAHAAQKASSVLYMIRKRLLRDSDFSTGVKRFDTDTKPILLYNWDPVGCRNDITYDPHVLVLGNLDKT